MVIRDHRCLMAALAMAAVAACGDEASSPEAAAPAAPVSSVTAPVISENATKDAYFGNFHVHTSYSFDGYANGSPTTPDDAFRWAKGEAIAGGGNGDLMQIRVPLDWYAVSDHAEFLGVFRAMEDPTTSVSKSPYAARITSDDQIEAFTAYAEILNAVSDGTVDPSLVDPQISRSIWSDVVATAERHDEPGTFTAFPAFEWTSNPGQQNLHRVVFFGATDVIPELPFSALDSDRPEDLWAWMDLQRADGARLLAIPHNGNASDGLMFPETTSYGGSVLDADFAAARMRNEPLYEISQIKGTSETHPDLSPDDPFAGFELWDYTLSADARRPARRRGSYVRDALVRGLVLEKEGRGNPFRYGFIGDSDTHNAAASIEEDNHTGKFGLENDPAHRLLGPPGLGEANRRQIREFSSGGVAGIWATANTREALFASLEARETFATSGPRMRVRFFGGRGFDDALLEDPDWLATAYAQGVPMGGELGPGAGSPTFVVWAMAETGGAHLDRVQVVKGWVEDGQPRERVFDVVLADGRLVGPDGSVAPVGDTVDAATATYRNDIGDPQLMTLWTDPEFDPALPAFWYVRVLQIPTPRWSTYDAVTLGVEVPEDLPVSIQERAWTSPIWYSP